MKPILLPLQIAFLWLVVGISTNHKKAEITSIALCRSTTAPEGRAFDPSMLAPQAVMIRRNIDALSAADIASIRTGVAAMKALPLTNPTSWVYQAAIHRTTLTNNLPSWNSCTHGSQYFLAWHRMYLYFFERILRKKSGNPNLTLPYWDYQTNPVLHAAYRTNSPGNALFHAARSASINAGGALGSGPMTSIVNSLNNIPYFDFNSAIEGPHGSIHGAIGGDMASVPTAAKDPCFWLHHTNIDRLWEQWLRKCGGRSNPTAAANAAWMNKKYTFFDENGAAVSMTLSQMLNTSSMLNYRYDFPPKLPCNFVVDWSKWKWQEVVLVKIPDPGPLINGKRFTVTKSNTIESFNKTVRDNKIERFQFSTTGKSDQLLLELENVKVDKQPEGVIEVYLNLPPNERPTAGSKSFVGVVDLFTATDNHAHEGARKGISLDASSAVRNLGIAVTDLSKASLTFITRGNTLRGQEVKTEGSVRVANANFVLRRVQ